MRDRNQMWVAGSFFFASVVTIAAGGWAQPEAVSFESLGLPDAARLPDRATVIFGWAQDGRRGWSVDRVRIDGRDRPEWDRSSQQPTVFYLRPGLRELRIYSTRSGHVDGDRRIRSRPVSIRVDGGQLFLCPLRLRAQGSRLPTFSCTLSEPSPDRNASPGAQATTETSGSESTSSSPFEREILDRLGALERRLERLEALLRTALSQSNTPPDDPARESRESRRHLRLDTTPPW